MYTTTQLIEAVKTRAAMPESQTLYTDARILEIASATARSLIVPQISKMRENFYEWDQDETIISSGIYNIPSRAIGGSIVNIALVDTVADSKRRLDLNWIDEEELDSYQQPRHGEAGVYIKRNKLYLLPPEGHGYPLFRITFNVRLGRFVPVTEAAQVTGVLANTVTFSEVPAAWTNSLLFDMIEQRPHFDWRAIELVATTVNPGINGTIIFANTPPSELAVGDWVAITDETPIIQLPVEWHEVLQQATANVCMRALNDSEGAKAGEEAMLMLESGASAVSEPRVQKEGRKLVNRTGIIRSTRR